MRERLTKRELLREKTVTKGVLRDSEQLADDFAEPLASILQALTPNRRETIAWALANAKLSGRLEGYEHALDRGAKPPLTGDMEEWLRNGDIIVHREPGV